MKKIILSLVLVLACVFSLSACSPPTITLFSNMGTQPEDSVAEFFSCLRSEDYDRADQLLQNLSTLGFDGAFSEELYSQMYRYLVESRSYTADGSSTIKGHSAELSISLTVLDFRKVETTLTEVATAKVADLEYAGTEVDDSMLDGIIQSCLSDIMQSPTDFYSTQSLVIQLHFEDGEWKIICSDELYSALVGYIV